MSRQPDAPDPAELATVRRLPVRQDGEVVDGVLVDEEEYQRLADQRTQAELRLRGYVSDVALAATTVRTVVTHRRTRRAGRAIARHGAYVLAGALIVARRLWDTHGSGRYERMLRAAEAAGDHELMLRWEERAEQAKAARHQRRMDRHQSSRVMYLAKTTGWAAGASLAGMLALGVLLAVATGDAGYILAPIRGVLAAIRWTAWLVAVAGGPLIVAAGWGLVIVLHQVGRHAGAIPDALAPVAHRRGVTHAPITPSVVVTALRDLGIPKLTTAVKEMGDGGAMMLSPIRIAGCGVEVDVSLPSGVSTNEVQDRRRKLAENMRRHEHELFITIPPTARTVRLWIADSGALDEPIGPSPLVMDPDLTADLYTGWAPWGQDLRGDLVSLSLLQCHLLITGLSNQGKTAALRALALWLLFDLSTEFRIADLKGIGDWHVFTGLATVLIEGPSDEHACMATEMLEEGVREMERRIAALDPDKYPDGVTRDLARKAGSGFHPIFYIVDEAQNAFMNPKKDEAGAPYGGKSDKSRYFMAARKIHNQGRAVNIILWQGTQNPTDQNLPVLVREGAHIRASLVVGTESQARMALGDKAVNGGAAPHRLRQGLDKGTLIVAGDGVPLPPGQSSITVRTYYIDGTAATEVAERAKDRRAAMTTRTGIQGPQRDLLEDVRTAMGGKDRVRSEWTRKQLADRWPGDYGRLSAQQFAQGLAAAGVVIHSGRVDGQGGQKFVSLDEILDALDARDQANLGADDGGTDD